MMHHRWIARWAAVALVAALVAACAGSGKKHARSASVMVTGADCRAACLAQLQGAEVVADCTPPMDMDPRQRDPWTTVCFFDVKK